MEELLAEVLRSVRSGRTAPEQVDLPLFRPDIVNAIHWIDQVEQIKTDFEWSELQILVRVGRFLTNDAKILFDNRSRITRNWGTFKNDF